MVRMKVLSPPSIRAAVKERLVSISAEPESGSSDELAAPLKREVNIWSKVIKDAGITIQ
jgi:tripartite-type tricarboxylate transporter receptor subunit TctC